MDGIPSRQSIGGFARAANLTAEERSRIATRAAEARWEAERARGESKMARLPRKASHEADSAALRYLAQMNCPSDVISREVWIEGFMQGWRVSRSAGES